MFKNQINNYITLCVADHALHATAVESEKYQIPVWEG